MPAPAAIPTLSPDEQATLALLLDPSVTLADLVASGRFTIAQLLDVVASPAIRAALEAIAEFNALRASAIASPARIAALRALAEVSESSDNPVERRRAAAAIIRGLGPFRRAGPFPRTGPPASIRNAAVTERTGQDTPQPTERTRSADTSAAAHPAPPAAPILSADPAPTFDPAASPIPLSDLSMPFGAQRRRRIPTAALADAAGQIPRCGKPPRLPITSALRPP